MADALGVSIGVIGAIAFLLVGIVVGITTYTMTGSRTISLLGTGGVVIAGALLGIFPLWVAFMYFVMAISTIAFSGFGLGSGNSEKQIKASTTVTAAHKSKALLVKIEQHSKNFSQYINNLDAVLGIRTVSQPATKGLELTEDKRLLIGDRYDWFIYGKHPEADVFKIVGLHGEDGRKNVSYLLGRHGDIPFLSKIPNSLMEKACEDCFTQDSGKISDREVSAAMDSQWLKNITKEESLK